MGKFYTIFWQEAFRRQYGDAHVNGLISLKRRCTASRSPYLFG